MSIQYEDAGLSGCYGDMGSFPKSFDYGPEEPDDEVDRPASTADKPRILLMGLRRSGKSSIQKVVFHKMSPNETLFLESTNKIYKDDISSTSFVQFQIWDFPGQVDFFDPTFDSEMIFKGTGALIFVIDAQDDYVEALSRLHLTVSRAYSVNPSINFEVFIHKVDGLSDDHKIETQRDVHQRANDDLADANLEKVHLSFYLTSIYDHSIFEAFSKVVQKLIPQLPTLENLLNIFISHSGIEKAFLFDVVSKIYIATDSSPVDMQSYELCCDMIDVVIDVSCIYGLMADGSGCAYDKGSMAAIRLNNTTVLYLKEVTKFLALVCILREESFEKKGATRCKLNTEQMTLWNFHQRRTSGGSFSSYCAFKIYCYIQDTQLCLGTRLLQRSRGRCGGSGQTQRERAREREGRSLQPFYGFYARTRRYSRWKSEWKTEASRHFSTRFNRLFFFFKESDFTSITSD